MNITLNFALKILIIIALIVIIIALFIKDKFKNVSKLPPHINQMKLEQLAPTTTNNVPNYTNNVQQITPKTASTNPGNIYRLNTGRDAYQQEQFVSIYDANFGGMLGTNMGH
tara:strand:- start:28 stop:363 length:336 start_codon:yes stop_codon:yes gene_type:complete